MKPAEHREDTGNLTSQTWMSEGWTGEQDTVSAAALAASLAIAALIFLFLAAGELHP
jgi:hypothetical protein